MFFVVLLAAANLAAQDFQMNLEVKDTFIVEYEAKAIEIPADSTGQLMLAGQVQIPKRRVPGKLFRPFIWVKGEKTYINRLAWFEPKPEEDEN